MPRLPGSVPADRERSVTATAVVITRSNGTQSCLGRAERIISSRGVVQVDDVPRVLGEDGGWIEYEDTACDTSGEEWEREDSCPTRIRIYSRGVVETMLLFSDAA